MTDTDDGSFDLLAELGADEAFSVQRFAIYLPNKDRNNKPVRGINQWIEAAMALLTDINGGVTKLPKAAGRFRVVEESGVQEIVIEDTVIVYSYIFDAEAFSRGFKRIKSYVDTFGKLTNQKAVMVEFSGEDRSYVADGADGSEEAAAGYYMQAYYISNYSEFASLPPWPQTE